VVSFINTSLSLKKKIANFLFTDNVHLVTDSPRGGGVMHTVQSRLFCEKNSDFIKCTRAFQNFFERDSTKIILLTKK
jgi:hypothetical protein